MLITNWYQLRNSFSWWQTDDSLSMYLHCLIRQEIQRVPMLRYHITCDVTTPLASLFSFIRLTPLFNPSYFYVDLLMLIWCVCLKDQYYILNQKHYYRSAVNILWLWKSAIIFLKYTLVLMKSNPNFLFYINNKRKNEKVINLVITLINIVIKNTIFFIYNHTSL